MVVCGDVRNVQAFQDDILIYTDTEEEHVLTLHKVLGILQDRGMTVKPSKCKLLVREVEYLGHLISDKGIKPKFCKIKAIQKAPAPAKDELRSFLGLCEYYAMFMPGYALTVQP